MGYSTPKKPFDLTAFLNEPAKKSIKRKRIWTSYTRANQRVETDETTETVADAPANDDVKE
ncbi:hypothetical protein [Ketogulonicigenium vulgare]|uniref:hypothetical protein n=1 Tax=Ketogulonicigenium vulgare TaxID=92945 RepID=UPI002358A16D|nr:hypothetical protein [Ketogulonicigenium vulgare]